MVAAFQGEQGIGRGASRSPAETALHRTIHHYGAQLGIWPCPLVPFPEPQRGCPRVPRLRGPGITDDLGLALDARNDMTPSIPSTPFRRHYFFRQLCRLIPQIL